MSFESLKSCLQSSSHIRRSSRSLNTIKNATKISGEGRIVGLEAHFSVGLLTSLESFGVPSADPFNFCY
jgi:hypothetical protein